MAARIAGAQVAGLGQALALLAGGAGHQAEAADLLAIQRRTHERVLFAAGEQAPGDDDALARDGAGRDVRAAPAGQALMEGAQRPGGAGGMPGRFDKQPADSPGPCLLILPCLAGSLPDCRTRGSSPRCPTRWRGVLNRLTSPMGLSGEVCV